ncbi:MAG: hypothetical protein A2293_11195 [Elusimicrobia bacterium RIFOXYB2_FULL_49_7]|nr:MAG: hypothetical protein A2293_11195 [Elusimicrobia bacterium RIFOXYB2_FULL_49_7]
MSEELKKWQVEANGLTYAMLEKLIPLRKVLPEHFPEKIIESPGGNYALLLYGGSEIGKEETVQNYILVKDAKRPYIILKSDMAFIYLHAQIYKSDTVQWSQDEEYLGLSTSVCFESCYEAKLIIDVRRNKFTLVPLAGSQYFQMEFLPRRMFKIDYIDEGAHHFDKILTKKTYLSRFHWLPLSEFATARKLFKKGYFGNLVGYKWRGFNKHFKNSRDEWPYEQQQLRERH